MIINPDSANKNFCHPQICDNNNFKKQSVYKEVLPDFGLIFGLKLVKHTFIL